jgi:ribose/xylose/arabinose/galactoside ABC-type transport system permease subunit
MAKSRIYPLIVLGAAALFLAFTPGFYTSQNIKSVLLLLSATGIAAVGLTAVTISGNLFSLSTAGCATVVAIIYARLTDDGINVVAVTVIVLAGAFLLGMVQGVIVSAGMNPIVTTLAVGAILSGLAPLMDNNSTLLLSKHSSTWLGGGIVLGVPVPILVFVLVTILTTILMRGTPGGRRLYLTGANKSTAEASGLRPKLTAWWVFGLASLAAGLAGLIGSGETGTVGTGQFDFLTFSTITAVLVGGAALRGGKGSPLATAVAAIFVALIGNYVALKGYSYGVQATIEGAVVCIAVVGYWITSSDSR